MNFDLQDEQTAQYIRLFNALAVGPLMIYAGFKSEDLPDWVKMSLIVLGLATVAHNGISYMSIDEQRKSKVRSALEEKAMQEALEEARSEG